LLAEKADINIQVRIIIVTLAQVITSIKQSHVIN
jgi:hypothetical protein